VTALDQYTALEAAYDALEDAYMALVARLEALAQEADDGGDHPTAARIRAALYDTDDDEENT